MSLEFSVHGRRTNMKSLTLILMSIALLIVLYGSTRAGDKKEAEAYL